MCKQYLYIVMASCLVVSNHLISLDNFVVKQPLNAQGTMIIENRGGENFFGGNIKNEVSFDTWKEPYGLESCNADELDLVAYYASEAMAHFYLPSEQEDSRKSEIIDPEQYDEEIRMCIKANGGDRISVAKELQCHNEMAQKFLWFTSLMSLVDAIPHVERRLEEEFHSNNPKRIHQKFCQNNRDKKLARQNKVMHQDKKHNKQKYNKNK